MNDKTCKNSIARDDMDLVKLISPDTSDQQRHQAFGRIVSKFQDMAYGYAYSLLGNSETAEEAAQEAFLVAWQKLYQLKQPQAFPAWFKRIVFTQSYGIGRRKRVETVSWTDVTGNDLHGVTDSLTDPQTAIELSEQHSEVRKAVADLPEGERDVVVLFYVNEYSREEISEFLAIGPVAVKKRLASARRRLKERMIHMVEIELHDQRPSRDGAFAKRVLEFSHQMADFLVSGTPILRTLQMCADAQKDTPRLQKAIRECEEEVRGGNPIRNVLERYPDLFSKSYIEAVSIGEIRGTLDIALERLSRGDLDNADKVRAFEQESRIRQIAQEQLPNVMGIFPHLFREHDLRVVAIGEQTGTIWEVTKRLMCGQEYDTEAKLESLSNEMKRLGEQLDKLASV